jgi:hypothetical protein
LFTPELRSELTMHGVATALARYNASIERALPRNESFGLTGRAERG